MFTANFADYSELTFSFSPSFYFCIFPLFSLDSSPLSFPLPTELAQFHPLSQFYLLSQPRESHLLIMVRLAYFRLIAEYL